MNKDIIMSFIVMNLSYSLMSRCRINTVTFQCVRFQNTRLIKRKISKPSAFNQITNAQINNILKLIKSYIKLQLNHTFLN